MSVLCRKCRIIEISDSNRVVQTSASGKKYVSVGSDSDFGKRLLLDYELMDQFPNLPNLSQSAANGCALCSVIKNEIIGFVGENPKYKQLFIHKVAYYSEKKYFDGKKYFDDDEPPKHCLQSFFVYFKLLNPEKVGQQDESHALRLEIQASSTDPCAEWLSMPRMCLEADVLSEPRLQRLAKLTDKALSVAPCATRSPQLPTRLVDVGTRGPTAEVEEPRLVITAHYPPLKGEDSAQRYIALSYCWGPPDKAKKQLKTETPTLHDRLHQIPLSSMPAAHQDAILVCRALGIRYVWIDSLCIIQDDKADWEREAQRMGSVYANSYLTVCAAQGDSCLDGFLQRDLPTQVVDIPFTSSIDTRVSGIFSMFVAPCEASRAHVEHDLFSGRFLSDYFNPNKPLPNPYRFATSSYDPSGRDIDGCNWIKRGWTFQESMLAPRALVFGARMVHVCIGGTWLTSEDGSSRDSPLQPPRYLLPSADEQVPVADTEMMDQWRYLAKQYASRSLTFQSDKFPALSAMAQVWHQMVKGQYLAGLFSLDLHRGLLWAHFGMRTPKQFLEPVSHEQYIAPSWSWASQSDHVSWVFHVRTAFNPRFDPLDSAVTVDGLNPYGRLTGGHLLLSAKICKIPTTRLRRESVFLGFIFPYELLADDGQCLAHVLFDWRHASVEAPKDPETGEEVEDGPVDRLSMVLISSKVTDAELKAQNTEQVSYQDLLLGLLVLPQGNPGEYKRAGLFFTEEGGMCGTKFWDSLDYQKVKLV